MRAWIVILLVGAAALAWWFLDGGGALDVPPVLDDDATVPENSAAPVLEGAAPTAPVATEGRYPITGVVLDDFGNPVAHVPLELWRGTRTWPGRGYDALLQASIKRITSRVGALLAGRGHGEVKVADSVSGADGRFAFRVDVARNHTVYARPEPPAAGGYASAYLIETTKPSADVKVRIYPGVSLEGRVVDPDGNPVGAEVRAHHKSEWQAFAQSDAGTGAFRIAAVPKTTLGFVLTLASGRQYRGFRAEPPFEDVVLSLPRGGGRVEGTVATPDGEPIAGAFVHLHVQRPGDKKWHESVELAARSDASGAFVIPDLPEGEITRTSAWAEGFLAAAQYAGRGGMAAIPLPAGGTATVDLTLRRGSVVHGRVTRKDGGTPIENATVTLYFLGYHPPQGSDRTTDADGRYRFEGLGDGKFTLLASHPQHFAPEIEAAVAQPWVGGRGSPPPHLSVVLDETDKTFERDLVLDRGVRLSGIVLDPREKPAPGAHVFIQNHGLQAVSQRWDMRFFSQEEGVVVSGPDGRFTVEGLPPRTDWVLYARKVGTAGIYTDPVSLADGPRDDVVVRLAEQCIVRGHVLDEKGKGLADCEIFVAGFSTLRGGPYRFKSQEDGSYELHSLPASQRLNLSTSCGGQRIEAKVDGLTPGEVREGVILQLGRQVEIAGTVRTSRGEAVPNVLVHTVRQDGLQEHRQGRTDANGVFRIENVTPGKLMLSVSSDGRRRVPVTKAFEVPGPAVDVTYDPPKVATIQGEVFLPDGKPLPIGSVQAWSSDGRRSSEREFQGGRFRVEARGKPPYSVSISKPRGADGTPLSVQPGYAKVPDPATPVTIRLQGGVDVSGRVVGEDGKGVVGVRIQANARTARSDMDGRWRASGLQPGRVSISVRPPPGFIPPESFVVDAGTADIVTKLEKGVSISGRVSVPDGVKVTGGRIKARWHRQGRYGPGQVNGRILSSATFTLTGVPPGILVRLEASLWQSLDVPVKVAPVTVEGVEAGRTDVVIEFVTGVSVSGHVFDPDGKPFAGGGVSLQRDRHARGYAETKEDGSFEVWGLQPGTYKVIVFKESRPLYYGSEVTAPRSGLEIRLPPRGSISGRLIGRPESEPWVVQPVWARHGGSPPNAQAKVAADGTWTLEGIDATRKVVVIARHEDGAGDQYARSGVVKVGATDVELKLETGLTISGRTQRGGSGVPHCSVHARAPGWSQHARSDADGNFKLRGLPPGRYKLDARAWPTGAKGSREDVAAGSTGVDIEVKD